MTFLEDLAALQKRVERIEKFQQDIGDRLVFEGDDLVIKTGTALIRLTDKDIYLEAGNKKISLSALRRMETVTGLILESGEFSPEMLGGWDDDD